MGGVGFDQAAQARHLHVYAAVEHVQFAAACQERVPQGDVREGVAYGSVICTMSMTPAEAADFESRMLAMPCVLAVDPY